MLPSEKLLSWEFQVRAVCCLILRVRNPARRRCMPCTLQSFQEVNKPHYLTSCFWLRFLLIIQSLFVCFSIVTLFFGVIFQVALILKHCQNEKLGVGGQMVDQGLTLISAPKFEDTAGLVNLGNNGQLGIDSSLSKCKIRETKQHDLNRRRCNLSVHICPDISPFYISCFLFFHSRLHCRHCPQVSTH